MSRGEQSRGEAKVPNIPKFNYTVGVAWLGGNLFRSIQSSHHGPYIVGYTRVTLGSSIQPCFNGLGYTV